jgi:predicted Fe-Mo cluster-binding NifX family protein
MHKKIAVPVDGNGVLDAHFGHCQFFTIVNVEYDKVVASARVQPPPHEPGLLPRWLAGHGVTDIIAGGMGQKAIELFKQNGINVFVGAPAINDMELVEKYLSEELTFSANYCDH